MVADVPVGAFLSGGLDSSMLVALANRKTGQAIECFTIDVGESKGEFIEDLPYAEKAAGHLSVPLNTLKITPDIVSFAKDGLSLG